jgi:hypothetical protein
MQSPEFKLQYYKKKNERRKYKSRNKGWAWWITSIIVSTQEAEIGRITVQGQWGQKGCDTILTNKKLCIC